MLLCVTAVAARLPSMRQALLRPKQPVSMRGSSDRFTQNFGHAWTGGKILPLVEECERKRGWWIDRHAYGRQACSVGAL